MAEPLAHGVRVEILRGKLAGKFGLVDCADKRFPGFWWVQPYNAQGALELAVLLQEGQLKRKEPPA